MKQLERVYLLNVLIYIHEIHSFRKFLEINKKCREVGLMLRIFKAKRCYDNTKNLIHVREDAYIPHDIFDLFPTIETIECNYEELFDITKSLIFDRVDKLRVTFNGSGKNILQTNYMNINQNILNKIESIKIHKKKHYFQFYFNSKSFPNLKKLVIINQVNINSILENNFDLQLDELVIEYSNDIYNQNYKTIVEEMKNMKQYKQIRRKTLLIWKLEERVKKELEKIFDVVCCPNVKTIDCSEFHYNDKKSINLNDILKYLSKSFFTTIDNFAPHIQQFDLRKCKSLERITLGNNFKKHIKIEGLENLKEIEFYEDMNHYDISEIPESVTTLVLKNFVPNQSLQQTLWENPNIKTLKIIENLKFKSIQNIVPSYLPNRDIELDEIIFDIDMLSCNIQLLQLLPFFELRNYPNIQKKTLNIYCLVYQPKYEEVEELRRFMNVNIEIKADINEIPENVKNLSVYGYFDWRFVEQPKLLSDIEYIFCLCCPKPNENSFINLGGFTKCKEMNIILPYGNVTFPPNLEELTVECHGETIYWFNLTIIPKLKRLRLRNYYGKREYQFLVPTQLEYLMLEGYAEKIIIDNINEIPTEIIHYNKNPIKERIFKRMELEA